VTGPNRLVSPVTSIRPASVTTAFP
jgi:hypothetical protein